MRHFVILFSLFLTFLSYQNAFARANSFVAKKIRPGDNIVSILRVHGYSDFDREKVLSQNSNLRKLVLTLDINYYVRYTNSGQDIRFYDLQRDVAFQISRQGRQIFVQEYRPQFRVMTQTFQGTVHGSLMTNIQNKTNSNWVASRFMDAYLLERKFEKQLNSGAKYSFVVEKKYDGSQFIKYGEILQTSLELNGICLNKKFVRFAAGGFFVSQKDLVKERPFYTPVDYIRIASLFQPNRRHPITKKIQPHLGIDFELPEGEPIYAAKKGIVVRYGRSSAAGNYIVLMHSNGVETAYNHMRRLERVFEGKHVQAGEKIGEVGCTGYCTKAHLHFAIKIHGRMVDPLFYIKPYSALYEHSQMRRSVAEN